MNIRQKNRLGKYLGLPITSYHPKSSDYQYIIDNMNNKLKGWKARFLTLAVRTTLVKSVLASIPTYAMQCNLLPKETCKHIDRIQRNFLCRATSEKRKLHLANWDLVTTPIKEGGLRIQKNKRKNFCSTSQPKLETS